MGGQLSLQNGDKEIDRVEKRGCPQSVCFAFLVAWRWAKLGMWGPRVGGDEVAVVGGADCNDLAVVEREPCAGWCEPRCAGPPLGWREPPSSGPMPPR